MRSRLTLTLLLSLSSARCGDVDPERADAGVVDVGGEARDASGDGSFDASDEPPAGDLDAADAPDLHDAGPPPALLGIACPDPSHAIAAQVPAGAARLAGPAALGGPGDFVLMNDRAAFVIQGRHEPRKTYWYYVGQPIDAVAIADCVQSTPDRFDELGFILGAARLDDFFQSTLRGFRADTIEVVSDGADGGPARVRARGADDLFWLIELEIIRRAFLGGSPRGGSEPLGVEAQVDYVLEPGSPVLRMELTLTNPGVEPVSALSGLVNFFGDTSVRSNYVDDAISLAGLGIDVGVPWIVSVAGDHSMAVAREGARPGLVSISGVDAQIDIDQFLLGATIAPGRQRTDTFFVTVAQGGIHAAIAPLEEMLPEPIPRTSWRMTPISVRAIDTSGAPVAGVEVVIEQRNARGAWRAIDGFALGASGAYDGSAAWVGARARRLRALAPGRAEPAPVDLGDPTEPILLTFGPSGALRVSVMDDSGRPMPGKVFVWDGDRRVAEAFSPGPAVDIPVAPGPYDVEVSRGFEYGLHRARVEVEGGGRVVVEAVLPRVLDTSGYLSFDGHVHAGPSPDSSIVIPLRALSVAAEGVEVAVSTDHEAILPWADDFVASGMRPFVATVLGQEVTAPMPEHSNAYPFPVRTAEGTRGVPVDWRRQDMAGLFSASRARGAQVVALNHPRNGCNWMCVVDYDRLTGMARLDDPALLGFPAGAALWDWGFDTVETMNGHANVFVDPGSPSDTGTFDDWMSFLNLGHRITATGVTDTHGWDAEGSPRNFFVAPTDDPAEFTDDMLVRAMLEGRSMVSAGAIARVAIGGAGLGDTVALEGGSGVLDIEVSALPEIDVQVVQVFANCDEIAWIPATDPGGLIKYSGAVPLALEADSHVVVVAHGAGPLPRSFPQFASWGAPRVITNPIYVDVDGGGYAAPGGRMCTYTSPRAVRPKAVVAAPDYVDAVPRLYPREEHCLCGG